MKKKIIITLSIVGIVVAIALFLTIQNLVSATQTKTVVMTTDPNDDVKIGKLVLDIVDETVNISSNTYTYKFKYTDGGLDDDANWKEKAKYAAAGKRLDLLAHADFNLTSDLLQVTEEDIVYDENTKTLTVYLSKPVMKVTYNTKTAPIDGDYKYEAIFSGGYSQEENFRIPENIVSIAEVEIPVKDPEKVEAAKNDITEGLSNLLTKVEQAKDKGNDETKNLESKEKIEQSVKELSKSVKRVDVLFKDN